MEPEDRIEQLSAQVAQLRAAARTPEDARAASAAMDAGIRDRAGRRQNIMTVVTAREPGSAGSGDVDASIRAALGTTIHPKEAA